jgi:DNA polymerase sigma
MCGLLKINSTFNKSNKKDIPMTQVSSGSLAEGLDLPGSDMDMMIVLNSVQVIQNVQHMSISLPTTLIRLS